MGEPRDTKRVRHILRHRDFRLLLTGFSISAAGDWLYGVALVVFVFNETGSPTWVGAATIVRLMPYIFLGPVGGVVADRYEQRTVMVISDVLRAILMFGLALVALLSAPVAIALAFCFLATVVGTPFGPAMASLLPRICDEDELAAGNALMSVIEHTALVVGPAIGAVLLLLGSPAIAFALNGITFLASAIVTQALRTKGSAQADQEEMPSIARRLAEGIAGIRASGAASLLVLFVVIAAFLYGFEIVFTVLLAEGRLGMGSEGVGWLTAAVGVGGVVAAAATTRIARSRRADLALLGSMFLLGFPLAALATTTNPVVAIVLMAFVGGGSILLDVVATTMLQRAVEEKLLARVFGIIDSLGVTAILVGSLVAPLLVNTLGIRTALLLTGITFPTLALLALPKLISLRELANRTMDDLAPRVRVLQASGAFDGATVQTLEALVRSMSFERVASGSAVVREGDPADDLFIVAEGIFEVLSRGETGGDEVVVNTLRPSDHFGEIGLLENMPRTASVRATEDAAVYRIAGGDFLELVNRAPSPPGTLVSTVINRLGRTHPSLAPTVDGEAHG